MPRLPAHGTYFEPFLGGGSVFFGLQPERARLSDLNPELIQAYCAIRDDVDAVIRQLEKWSVDAATYYSLRSANYRNSAKRAARLVFLSKTAWNGLWRVNRHGKFNVPYGRRTSRVFSPDELRVTSTILRRAVVSVGDFEAATATVRSGDLVYFDPPYTVLHDRNGFVRYNEKLFSWTDQARLASIALELARGGAFVVVSNANHPALRKLYSEFSVKVLSRRSLIAGTAAHRRITNECVFASFSLNGANS